MQARIDEQIAPFAKAVTRLDEIPGRRGHRRADHHRRDRPGHDPVPDPGAPGVVGQVRTRDRESAGRKKGNSGTGHGNRYLARALGEAAVGAGRTNTFLGERYRRIARRRGKKRAIVAVGRSILMIVWQLLNDEEKRFVDLGPGYYESRDQPQPQHPQPRPRTPSPGLQSHPRTRRLINSGDQSTELTLGCRCNLSWSR